MQVAHRVTPATEPLTDGITAEGSRVRSKQTELGDGRKKPQRTVHSGEREPIMTPAEKTVP